MGEREKACGGGYPRSLSAALRRASDVDVSGNKIVLDFKNQDNADAAYDWLLHIKDWRNQ
ncbi:hypothetical protein ACFPOD_04765 [Nitratireductor kimnyeongensis]|uniref:Uncharacterized protein n=1 Tax=Nitratireductor kimnyeongensis TaxID=430679 RepID=A0ABW0T6H6_9HYPH|nr:hypothetical protein [Nitratireductor kimnyeongensis]QZZ34602.1 hypothetical protein KW403_12430 [Nitratireductor kimnyeongensis]